jgi:C4-dicarboxylate-specific signal transduction histidine kinase
VPHYNCRISTTAIIVSVVVLLAAGVTVGLGLRLLRRTSAIQHGKLAAVRRERDQAVREAQALLEDSPLGVLVHADGRVLQANARLHALLGREPGALTGESLETVVPPDEMARFLSLGTHPSSGAGAGGGAGPAGPLAGARGEFRLVRADGGAVCVEASARAVARGDGQAAQVLVSDLTAREEAEGRRRELADLARRQEEQLEHSTRLAELGGMAAAISHELNQPLTGIRNYARNAYYMIEKGLGGAEDVKGNLRLISEQVDRAAKIINQMRELTRRADRTSAAIDVNSVVRESLDFLMPQMRLSEVQVSLSLAADLPPVWGDRVRLAQVLLNLLTNARQAMDGSPERRLGIESRREAETALPVVVEIADTGRGFSREEAARLFQPFFTTRAGGHGLGLSISRAIVKDHGGTIEAAGSPGEGARFTLRLPANPGGEGGAA